MEKTRKQEILASLTMVFDVTRFYEKGKNKSEVLASMTAFLDGSEYETGDIVRAVRKYAEKSQNAPTPADIFEILKGNIEVKIEQKWLYFLDHVIRPKRYEIDIEPWAYDIKRLMALESRKIGVDDDLVWVKKDFVEHVTRQINGEVEIRGQGEEWQLIDGQMKLQAPKKQDDRPKMIGQVLESKEEYEKVSKFKIKRYLSSLSKQEFKALNDEVFEMVTKESFIDDLVENNTFFKAMAEAKINQVVLDRIKQQESIKPILKVG